MQDKLREALRKLTFALEQPINNWAVRGSEIYHTKSSDGPLVRDRAASPQTLELIADALNFVVRQKMLEEVKTELEAALTPAEREQTIVEDASWAGGFVWTCKHGNRSGILYKEMECGCELTITLVTPPIREQAGAQAELSEEQVNEMYELGEITGAGRDRLNALLRSKAPVAQPATPTNLEYLDHLINLRSLPVTVRSWLTWAHNVAQPATAKPAGPECAECFEKEGSYQCLGH